MLCFYESIRRIFYF